MSKPDSYLCYIAGTILAFAGVASNVAAAPDSFVPSSGMSPFLAAAEQAPPESGRASDSRRQRQLQSRGMDVERHKRRLEVDRRAVAPAGAGNNAAPSLPNATLQLPDATLKLPNAVPQLPGGNPQLPNAVPQLPNAIPQMPDAAPPVPGGAPPLPAVEPPPDRL
jgi:hypothetical protein